MRKVKWRKLKKTLLVVGCFIPGPNLICGDELANPKYGRPKDADKDG